MVKITTLTSVFNGERFLRESIESVLNQTFQDFEFIIVDDGSTDKTPEILDSYRDSRIVRIVNSPNLGLIESLNKGLERAKGELIARHDADDISLPNRLEKQAALLDKNPDYVLVGSTYELITESGRPIRVEKFPTTDAAIRWHSLFHNPFAHNAVMFRGDVIRANGLRYDKNALHAEDYAFWSKLLQFGRAMNDPYPLVKYRLHGAQVSQTGANAQRQSANAIARENLKALGYDLTEAQVVRLRSWYDSFPLPFRSDDSEFCEIFFNILETFARQHPSERKLVRSIRRQLLYRTLKSSTLAQAARLRQTPFFNNALRYDGLFALLYFVKAMLFKAKARLLDNSV